jgi:hypothetical protein
VLWCFGALVLSCFAALVFWCLGAWVLGCLGAWVLWCFGALHSTHTVAPRTPNSCFALRDRLWMSFPGTCHTGGRRPSTLNPSPFTPIPKHQTPNFKPYNLHSDSQTPHPKP